MAGFAVDDDCYGPRREKFVNYSGPDPFAWEREAIPLLRNIWEVSTTGTGEPRWMWDWTGDPIQMYSNRTAYHSRTAGRFARIVVSIKMVGFKYKAKNEGNFKMEIIPSVQHKFGGNKLVMFFWWIYWHTFYNTIRQSLIERCKQMADTFIDALREIYGMGSIEVSD